MPRALASKKVLVSIIGILAVSILALFGRDIEVIKWVGALVAGIVSSLNVAQGFADGMSGGKTSSSSGVARRRTKT